MIDDGAELAFVIVNRFEQAALRLQVAHLFSLAIQQSLYIRMSRMSKSLQAFLCPRLPNASCGSIMAS